MVLLLAQTGCDLPPPSYPGPPPPPVFGPPPPGAYIPPPNPALSAAAPPRGADVPFSAAHVVGGTISPALPVTPTQPVKLRVLCRITAEGWPEDCNILRNTGADAFAKATLDWLTGPHRPRYQPAIQNGVAVASEHTWEVTFAPPPPR